MRYIVHGDDTVSSRSYLNNLKSQYQDLIILDGKVLNQGDFLDLVSTQPLLPRKTLVVIENYKGSESIFKTKIVLDVVFWWSRNLQKVPKGDKVQQFKNQDTFGIFRYVDSVGFRQQKRALVLLNKLLEERVPAEKIIAMLTRQFRMIGQVLDGEDLRVSSSIFVRNKLAEQSNNWNFQEVQEVFVTLFLMDVKIKKGYLKPTPALTFLTSKICGQG